MDRRIRGERAEHSNPDPLTRLLLLLLLLLASRVRAEEAVVLSGGGSLGIAHAGALLGIERRGHDPGIVLGTSMGAIVGSLYAAGYDPDSIWSIMRHEDWRGMFTPIPTGLGPTVTAGPVIEAVEASKRYGDVLAVDRVTVRVEQGEIYALLGLNGAGKSTLIRLLLGMVRPTGGRVGLFGTPVTAGKHDVWSRVGYLVEAPTAYPELSVRENLDVVRRLRRIGHGPVIEDVMKRLGLAAYADRRARTLSLGNAQRLGLAKAMLHRPQLLILDEPANGLDPAGVVEIRELLRDLAAHGTTVFLSSHVLGEVARLATRIGIIHSGQLREELDADDLAHRVRRWLCVTTRDDTAAARVLAAAGYAVSADVDGLITHDRHAVDAPDAVAVALVRAGVAPTRLVVEREDLESYFLRTVGVEHG